jgi:hypothetical protein
MNDLAIHHHQQQQQRSLKRSDYCLNSCSYSLSNVQEAEPERWGGQGASRKAAASRHAAESECI